MTNNIRIDSSFLTSMNIQGNKSVSYLKEAGIQVSGENNAETNNAADTILNISKEAKIKLENERKNREPEKKAGTTSAREVFEDQALDQRNYIRNTDIHRSLGWPQVDLLEEWMRLDEPETYSYLKSIDSKYDYSGNPLESNTSDKVYDNLSEEYVEIMGDWFDRKCRDEDGMVKNPVTGKTCVVYALEELYSDNVHDTSIDAYGENFSEKDSSIWRFNTKFNVLLPVKWLNELETITNFDSQSDEKNTTARKYLGRIDSAVTQMKEVEKNYEGNLKSLRFGVKFNNGGTATYYANYAGCEEKNGIMADSAEELLEKLMSK